MKIEGGADHGESNIPPAQQTLAGRFVLLRHSYADQESISTRTVAGKSASPLSVPPNGFSHWDLMLEAGLSLRTFQLRELPLYRPHGPVQYLNAKRIADHRPLYLDYEGEVSGNRGSVRRVAWGTYQSKVQDAHWERILLSRERPLATLHFPDCQIDEEFQLEVWSWSIPAGER